MASRSPPQHLALVDRGHATAVSRRPWLSTATGTQPGPFGPLEWGLLAATASMWGSSFLWIAEGLESLSPPLITLLRLLLGASALALVPRTRAPVERADLPRVAFVGVVWMAIPFLLFPIAQQWVDSSVAGMVNGATPLFAGVIAALLLRSRPGATQVAGLVVGFAGVSLISVGSVTGAGGSLTGVVLLLVATACYGLALNVTVPLAQRYGSLPVILRAQVVAVLLVLPFGIAGIPGSTWDWGAAGAMLLLGVLSSGVAFVTMSELTRRVGATRGSVTIYLIPVVAVALGVAVRGERVTWPAIAGTILVLFGAWLSSRREGR